METLRRGENDEEEGEESHFGCFIGGKEDVGGLDISVNHTLVSVIVQVPNGLCHPHCHLISDLPCQHLPPFL